MTVWFKSLDFLDSLYFILSCFSLTVWVTRCSWIPTQKMQSKRGRGSGEWPHFLRARIDLYDFSFVWMGGCSIIMSSRSILWGCSTITERGADGSLLLNFFLVFWKVTYFHSLVIGGCTGGSGSLTESLFIVSSAAPIEMRLMSSSPANWSLWRPINSCWDCSFGSGSSFYGWG